MTMAKIKKNATEIKSVVPAGKSISVKTADTAKKSGASAGREKSGEELVIENFAAVSRLVETLAETLELLTQKTESMAYHIIATEEILAELVAENGINLARVNTRIRRKIDSGTNGAGDAGRAIDLAASIASPQPRRQ
jgi:ribosomal protein L9